MEGDLKAVTVQNVWKAYGGVPVLKGVDFEVHAGQIHALLGGNGAGKSTLMKIIAGLVTADRGDVNIGGFPLRPAKAKQAHKLGLYLVPQEAQVFPNLSVLENILIGVDGAKPELVAKVERHMAQLGVDLKLDENGSTLEVADQQVVEILRGLVRNASFLILDEPTSALTPREAGALFKCMRSLTRAGVGLIFISHKLREIREICDHISVLRDGQLVLSKPLKETSDTGIIVAMTKVAPSARPDRTRSVVSVTSEAVLSTDKLSGEGFENISFQVGLGEIVGLAGVVGSGRTELAETLVGLRAIKGGKYTFGGAAVTSPNPRSCADMGLVYLPEDRQGHGLFLDAPIGWNISSAIMHRLPLLLSSAQEHRQSLDLIRKLGIKCTRPAQPARRLSGGNQQKVLLAKCLASRPRFLILDEPTRGVDVSARNDIYGLIHDLANAGTSVLLISSDFDEIEQVSDRAIIMMRGQIVGQLGAADLTVKDITRLAFAAVEGM